MTTKPLTQERVSAITSAVKRVYEEAELDPAKLKSEIVPLYELIGAYPLRVAALKDLTYQSAIKFLSAEIGQPVIALNHKDRKISGLLYVYEFAGLFYGFILVDKNHPISRQRFSAAHELGHYLLHFLPILERSDWQSSSKSLLLAEGPPANKDDTEDVAQEPEMSYANGFQAKTYQPPIKPDDMEREADQFATELLMPATVCQSLVQRHLRRRSNIQRDALAIRLAPDLLVSKTAMGRRLESLGLPEDFKSDSGQ